MAEPLTDEGGEETGVLGETPGDELQKMPHPKVRRFKTQARLCQVVGRDNSAIKFDRV